MSDYTIRLNSADGTVTIYEWACTYDRNGSKEVVLVEVVQ